MVNRPAPGAASSACHAIRHHPVINLKVNDRIYTMAIRRQYLIKLDGLIHRSWKTV
jgi:hypothetical protein